MKKIKLKEIAEHFDVSVSTVSKAINNKSEISRELRQKIQKFAKENHYVPNRVALSLLNRQTKTIGVVVPNILNYFFAQVFYGIEKVADQQGYSIISCISDESHRKEVRTLQLLNAGTVDGLIVSLSKETQRKDELAHFQEVIDHQIPLVMFDRVSDKIECDKVIVDDLEGGYKATKHFLDTGCKVIAIVSSIDDSSVGKLRVEGYKKALMERDIPFDDKLILDLDEKDDLEVLMSLLLGYKKIDAIMALDELTAVEVLRILKLRNYTVPDDISLIGFTNGRLSQYVTPNLTTISQHGKYIGETAARLLIDRIEGKGEVNAHDTKVIKTSLIVRNSTKKIE